MAYAGPICDSHIHFWDFEKRPNPHLAGLIGTPACNGGSAWYPENYIADLQSIADTTNITSLVHIETIDEIDPVGETKWIASLAPALGGRQLKIVCFVDLCLPSATEQLAAQVAASRDVVGVRHILNHNPSWPNVKANYLEDPTFRGNFAKLADHGLSFDLQINPHQMDLAAEVCASAPSVPVCLNHLGCPKLTSDACDSAEDQAAIVVWRSGMAKLAALPHVCVKLSILDYVAVGFQSNQQKEAVVRGLVQEAIALFGADRCMFASNVPVGNNEGVPLAVYYQLMKKWAMGFSEKEQRSLFHDTAARFYKIA